MAESLIITVSLKTFLATLELLSITPSGMPRRWFQPTSGREASRRDFAPDASEFRRPHGVQINRTHMYARDGRLRGGRPSPSARKRAATGSAPRDHKMTAHSLEEGLRENIEAAMDLHLTKPIDKELTVEAVYQICN
ncbi:hypothetical protein BRADI_4g10804v3 [Brachypodium distachyon]|uniref:Uncharacterized protein n=1 Tax=Brachypodium distachyon TaxID=15368 RepID=A0A0Q3EI39_BRADI|nr:hypothetical protein BRADI_4g10804v3 [Brachypodium distachyon]